MKGSGHLALLSVLMFCAMFVPLNAFAEFILTKDFYLLLMSSDVNDQKFASGYILGVADAGDGKNTKLQHCFSLPDNISVKQMREVVAAHIKGNPNEGVFGATGVIELALSQHYPCKAQK